MLNDKDFYKIYGFWQNQSEEKFIILKIKFALLSIDFTNIDNDEILKEHIMKWMIQKVYSFYLFLSVYITATSPIQIFH